MPNFAFTFLYFNQPATLKVELTLDYVMRLLAHMRRAGHRVCRVPVPDRSEPRQVLVEFLSSGYMERARAKGVWPLQGLADPWRLHQNVFLDWWLLKRVAVDDGVLRFS